MSNEKKEVSVSDPYAVLEVTSGATEAEIKQAYFRQVRQHPPESDPQTFKRIRAAYEVLKDPRKRLEVDLLQPEIWPEETVPAKKKKAKASAVLDLGDVRRAVRAFTEISKRDFREDYQPVKLPS